MSHSESKSIITHGHWIRIGHFVVADVVVVVDDVFVNDVVTFADDVVALVGDVNAFVTLICSGVGIVVFLLNNNAIASPLLLTRLHDVVKWRHHPVCNQPLLKNVML